MRDKLSYTMGCFCAAAGLGLEVGEKKRRGHLAPSLLSVCSGIAPIYRRPLISVGQVPGRMEDQVRSFVHQRKLNFIHGICYLVVIVMYSVKEEDHRDIKLSEVVVVRTVVEAVWIVFCIVSVVEF